jgi:hypothetical protein
MIVTQSDTGSREPGVHLAQLDEVSISGALIAGASANGWAR